jgi:uncharacterized Rmd1/YagE family protein
MKFFKARQEAYGTDPRTIEDVIYTPYAYEPGQPSSGASRSSVELATGDLLGIPELHSGQVADGEGNGSNTKYKRKRSKFDAAPAKAEVFIFKYGTVVIWGMTEQQEKRFLSSM